MKKAVTLFLFFSLLLFPALATAKIPAFKETGQYRDLASYVDTLEGLEDTPAAEEQKDAYTANLNILLGNASARVNQLNNTRKQRAENDFSKRKAKILASAKKTAKAEKQKAKNSLEGALGSAEDFYQSRLKKISSKYKAQIAKLNKQIKKLQRKLEQTENTSKILLIEEKINQLEDRVAENERFRDREKRAAQARYNQKVTALNNAYEAKINRINERFRENLAKRNREARETHNKRLVKIANIWNGDKNTVSDLETRGRLYIANMPAVTS